MFATFILALLGLFVVVTRRGAEPWWRFILYGLVISIVPGAIGIYQFHATRLLAYPVFLLVLMVPALEWLLAGATTSPPIAMPRVARFALLFVLLILIGVEAWRYQKVFRREGPKRAYDFDVPYKTAYDAATKQPSRPIYLEDGRWGPAYIHALWYAVLEKRPRSEFVHLKPGARAPEGAIVISSGDNCQRCETLMRSGVYQVYKSL